VQPGDVEVLAALAATRGWPFARGEFAAIAGEQGFESGRGIVEIAARAGEVGRICPLASLRQCVSATCRIG
jgi:hypothetical protein